MCSDDNYCYVSVMVSFCKCGSKAEAFLASKYSKALYCTGRLCLGISTDCRLLYWVGDVYKTPDGFV